MGVRENKYEDQWGSILRHFLLKPLEKLVPPPLWEALPSVLWVKLFWLLFQPHPEAQF